MSSWTAASSDCSRPVNNYVHVKTADLYRPNARLTPERQGYQVLTPFGKLGYSHIEATLVLVVAGRRHEHCHQRRRVTTESRVNSLDTLEAPEKQTSANEQHQRNGDLAHHKSVPEAEPTRLPATCGLAPEDRGNVGLRRLERWNKAEHDPGDQRKSSG